MLAASLDSVAGGLGALAVAGAFVAAVFVFRNRLGRRTTAPTPHFPTFALAVAIAITFVISLTLANWWFFAIAILALPGLFAVRWGISKFESRRAA
ncbi:hypothetical protein [Microbacterium oxydans]|uniref:hypothetical protein n=1 Tax=Microbacterium oxydans TaxID=82380 RepID=UPI00226BA65B|nr:hypothetical protein [Microbacterium oxydans]WAA65649.1 hypothetical protein MME74_15665 [Microbacterium oxydans]